MEGFLREADEGGDSETGGSAEEVSGSHREARAGESRSRRSLENARDCEDQSRKGDFSPGEIHSGRQRRSCHGILAEDVRTPTAAQCQSPTSTTTASSAADSASSCTASSSSSTSAAAASSCEQYGDDESEQQGRGREQFDGGELV